MRLFPSLAVLAAIGFGAAPAGALESLWEASSGQLPEDACPPWTASIGDSVPLIVDGSLRIRTADCPENAYYHQSGEDIAIPGMLEVELKLRLETRGECVGPCGHFRDAGFVGVTTAPHVGTALWVGDDEIFITNGECNGITSVAVDTKLTAHVYRILVDFTGEVTIEYDGTPVLTGHTYHSTNDYGSVPRIAWGEASILAFGTTHWEYVRHNAHATGCESVAVEEVGTGAAGAGATASPNPFRVETALHYATMRPGRVIIDIYDPSGRSVRRLRNANVGPGDHRTTWDGLDTAGRKVHPGLYLYRIATAEGDRTGKVMLFP
jgi:hypothetical protein